MITRGQLRYHYNRIYDLIMVHFIARMAGIKVVYKPEKGIIELRAGSRRINSIIATLREHAIKDNDQELLETLKNLRIEYEHDSP